MRATRLTLASIGVALVVAALDLASDPGISPTDRYGRLALRAEARAIGDPNLLPLGACRLLTSLGVFDAATGRTTVLAGPAAGLVQPPEPD